jgi:hypothetical protein
MGLLLQPLGKAALYCKLMSYLDCIDEYDGISLAHLRVGEFSAWTGSACASVDPGWSVCLCPSLRSFLYSKPKALSGGFMDEYKESAETGSHTSRWLAAAVVVLFMATGMAAIYAYQQRSMANQFMAREMEMHGTIDQLQNQIGLLSSKISEMTLAQAAATAAPKAPAGNAVRAGATASTAGRRVSRPNPLRRIQAQLDKQQKQLNETEEEVNKTRSDLEGNLNSTRDELNGSIAKTHGELVALEQRGERNYFEFDLVKSKQFHRTGPVMISLRHADPKHQHLDLMMIVNDNEISKKNINLYEPLWIYDTQESQPLQVVINKIDKNRVHGYVSAPKYPSEQTRVIPASATTTLPPAQPSTAGAASPTE